MTTIDTPTVRHSAGAPAATKAGRTGPLDTAQALERHLGNPHDPANSFSFARVLEYDRRESFPARACRALEDWGIERYYVPAAHRGALDHYDEILHLMRVIARRDLTVAIGHGKTYLGAVCVWMGGKREQADSLAARILDGAIVSLALTERAHGSDLLAGDVVAKGGERGWALTGEKWLINNATRGDTLCVLTRTAPEGGPRGFTLLLVEKDRLQADSFRHLPKVPTHGIRGADISGIAFTDAVVPHDAVVGEQGQGLEILLRSLQITRTMCASLSLGAADTALRTAAAFALERRLYGRRLIDMPTARRALADVYADVLIAEIVSTVAARSLDVLPAEASVSSAIAKYLVPTTVDGLVARAGHLLGARAFLEHFHAHGLFQKTERDQRIVGLFDGNTLVNLQSVINQGPALARAYARRHVAPGAPAALEMLFDMSVERPQLEPGSLRMVSRHGCAPLQALESLVDRLEAGSGGDASLAEAAAFGRDIIRAAEQVHARLRVHPGPVGAIPATSFTTAQHYATCYAAASAIGVWLYNRVAEEARDDTGLWAGGRWLSAVLGSLLRRLAGPSERSARATDALIEPLLIQTRRARLYSLFGLQLSEEEVSC